MKKVILVFAAFLALFLCMVDGALAGKTRNALESYLHKYFGSGNYQILKGELPLGEMKLIVAVRYADSKKGIVAKGIGVTVDGGKIIPRVFFEKNKVLDGARKAVVDVSIFHREYYGWLVQYSIPKNPAKFQNGFLLTYISRLDGHLVTADPIRVDWNPGTGVFQKSEANYE